ncbi:cadherin-86C [Diabrotica virgifera virgifera]|nr:cadherin-86C [Diabrotica virgifera virgifera]
MRCWLLLMCGPFLATTRPSFDSSALLRDVLVPADAAVGSVFYRLRASDPTFDYPLEFHVAGQSSIVGVESLNCSRFNSVCQANLIIKKRLEANRFYDFTIETRNQRGETSLLDCSFRATNATTPLEKIFPGAPSLLSISESARRNTELGTIRAMGNPRLPRSALLELWGSPEFGLHQKLVTEKDAEGTVVLLSSLDYEKKTVHHLTILANDPWTNMAEDTRNIAGWPLLISVLDEQDTPPVFTIAPPTTTLSPNLSSGDLILRVHAEDGDRGNPRDIRYGLVPDKNPFVTFFSIDETTGELRLARPLSEILSISHTGQPILLTVVAEEVRSNPKEAPAQSTTVQLALIPPGVTAGTPTFGAIEYNALLDENSPIGTVLDLPQAEISIQPGDVVTLELLNNNGTFEINPKVVESNTKFQISVRNPKYLDYDERQSVECYIIAKEISAGNYTAKAKLTVLLNDVNDNPPKFSKDKYYGTVQEHAKVGTHVLVVEAIDIDKNPNSKIQYTKLTGKGSELFNLDSDTGLITVADPIKLDAEETPLITLKVEAADDNGEGLKANSTVEIKLVDINDNPPIFEKEVYEFILKPDRTGFTSPAFIKATDKDISPPNNEIHYEIINLPENLYIDEASGELLVTKIYDIDDIVTLRARAWDGGVPRLYNESEIRVYPPEGQSRKMVFIVPGSNPDKLIIADTLRTLTGGKVAIDRIRPYTGYEPGATYVTHDDDKDRSVVEATVTFSKGSVVDLDEITKIINQKVEEHRVKEVEKEKEREIIKIQESSSTNLTWLLILFIVLLLLAILIMLICCLCRPCPLYHYYTFYRNRKETPSVEKIEKVRIIGAGEGRDSKSVQVAEWFGRKEAWTPDQDVEAESLRRHEVDRGSDQGGVKRAAMQRQSEVQHEPLRDQYYIREGNADILRLITRGGEPQRGMNMATEQQYMASDTGKDILMRRYIEQQQADLRSQVLLPNAVRAQSEHELLEASLRQQNALLRQILLDRERDLRLETQSLPAGTQTDQDAGTQTEPELLKPPKREIRSDNDQSEYSDEEDELAIIKARAKRRNGRKTHIKRKIKTPIQEEVELEIEHPHKEIDRYIESRVSEVRQKRAPSETMSIDTYSSKSELKKEVLEELLASLEQSFDSDSGEYHRKKERLKYLLKKDIFSDDSLEISGKSDEKASTDSSKQRYHSEIDLRAISSRNRRKSSDSSIRPSKLKSRSQMDLSQISGSKKSKSSARKINGGPRYMDWYKKSDETKSKNKEVQEGRKKEAKKEAKDSKNSGTKPAVSSRLLMDTESSKNKKVDNKKNSVGPDHPLLQHSEYRFEGPYFAAPNQPPKKPEEDNDSGIALTKPPIAQKKSVFTIAYDDMHTNQLRADDSVTSP